MRKILFISLCTIFSTIVYGQKADSLELFLTEFQKVAFVTSDSTYKFTRFITSDGKFYFKEGFVDPYHTGGELFFGSSDLVQKTGEYKLTFKSGSDHIDTINNYFPVRQTKNNQDLLINISDELGYSYILRQVGETDRINLEDNIIRVLYPCEELNYCTLYHVFTIRFFADSAKLYIHTGRTVDFGGIQLIQGDSCLLKKRDIESIMKQMTTVKPIPDMTCRRPGNPWVLEYNDGTEYKRFAISNYCLRGQKDLRPVATLCYLILGTGNKYFDTNCSLSH